MATLHIQALRYALPSVRPAVRAGTDQPRTPRLEGLTEVKGLRMVVKE